jgi:NifU-like protein involved in Fe-S cluster formation
LSRANEALKITSKDISDALGGLPEQKLHCSVLGEEAIRNAVADYMKTEKLRSGSL